MTVSYRPRCVGIFSLVSDIFLLLLPHVTIPVAESPLINDLEKVLGMKQMLDAYIELMQDNNGMDLNAVVKHLLKIPSLNCVMAILEVCSYNMHRCLRCVHVLCMFFLMLCTFSLMFCVYPSCMLCARFVHVLCTFCARFVHLFCTFCACFVHVLCTFLCCCVNWIYLSQRSCR